MDFSGGRNPVIKHLRNELFQHHFNKDPMEMLLLKQPDSIVHSLFKITTLIFTAWMSWMRTNDKRIAILNGRMALLEKV